MHQKQQAPVNSDEFKTPDPMTGEVLNEADPTELPENAFRELAADENYRPLMHPARNYIEVTAY
ncbi:MAG: hypothetical protein K2G95_04845, partial [Muribaculaceae bacterium]|nr:hypothetical protein [Muribaculaceae bacterium]